MILALLFVGLGWAGDEANAPAVPSAEAVQAQTEAVQDQVQEFHEKAEELLTSQRALLCYLKDREALANKEKDVPTDWKLPEYSVYELAGATCSQIPSRQKAELLLREQEATKKVSHFPVTVEP